MNDGGLAKLKRRLMAIPQQVRDDMQIALDRQANELAATMKQLAPGDGPLQDSIQVEQARTYLARAVVAGGETTTRPVKEGLDVSYDYAFAQELGTAEMEANPFFYPSIRMLNKRIKRRLKAAAARAVKKNWGKK
jgi:hypothetical protein